MHGRLDCSISANRGGSLWSLRVGCDWFLSTFGGRGTVTQVRVYRRLGLRFCFISVVKLAIFCDDESVRGVVMLLRCFLVFWRSQALVKHRTTYGRSYTRRWLCPLSTATHISLRPRWLHSLAPVSRLMIATSGSRIFFSLDFPGIQSRCRCFRLQRIWFRRLIRLRIRWWKQESCLLLLLCFLVRKRCLLLRWLSSLGLSYSCVLSFIDWALINAWRLFACLQLIEGACLWLDPRFYVWIVVGTWLYGASSRLGVVNACSLRLRWTLGLKVWAFPS